jgi:hypothetical protein
MLLAGRVDPRVVLKTEARKMGFSNSGRRWAPPLPVDPAGGGGWRVGQERDRGPPGGGRSARPVRGGGWGKR